MAFQCHHASPFHLGARLPLAIAALELVQMLVQ